MAVALLNAVFFYNGVNFLLRGGEEHRELKISQFHFRNEVIDPENPDHMISCVEYREHGSKNRPGERHQLNLENKVVVQYEPPELGEWCQFLSSKTVFDKLPPIVLLEAKSKSTFFAL